MINKNNSVGKPQELAYSDFMVKVEQGGVGDGNFSGEEARGKFKDGNPAGGFHVIVPANYPGMYDVLRDHGVKYTIKDAQGSNWPLMLIQFSPLLLLAVLWFVMIRQMQSGGNKALSFGKSRARLLSMQQKKITFKDVAGLDRAQEGLPAIIEFLREAPKFQKLRGRIPKGVLLVGH